MNDLESDDDDDDPRPRRRRPARTPAWVWGLVAALVLSAAALAGLTAYLLIDFGALTDDAPPPGYTRIRDPKGGYRVFLPGRGEVSQVVLNGEPDPNRSFATCHGDGLTAHALSTRRPGWTPPADPDGLAKEVAMTTRSYVGWKTEEVSRTPVTLGGRPGVRLVLKEVADLWEGKHGRADGFWADKDRKETERVAKEGKHAVIFVASDGRRLVEVVLVQAGKPVDPAAAEVVAGSLQFL